MAQTMFLKGKRVLVTREESQAQSLCAMISEHGGVPVLVPLLSFQRPSPDEWKAAGEKVRRLQTFDWLVLTSKNGVHFFLELAKEFDLSPKAFPKIAAIGKKTEMELGKHGLQAAFIPKSYVAEAFLPEFLKVVRKEEAVLIAKGNLARDYIYKGLCAQSIQAEKAVVYSNKPPAGADAHLIDTLKEQTIDLFLFTSPSAVEVFMRIVCESGLQEKVEGKAVVTIGPVTKERAERLGLSVDVSPEQYTIEDMLKEIDLYYQNKECKS